MDVIRQSGFCLSPQVRFLHDEAFAVLLETDADRSERELHVHESLLRPEALPAGRPADVGLDLEPLGA